MQIVFLLCALVAVAFVLLISMYLILSGLPAIREVGLREFLFGRTWASTRAEDPRFGILPMMFTSIYGAAGAIVLVKCAFRLKWLLTQQMLFYLW